MYNHFKKLASEMAVVQNENEHLRNTVENLHYEFEGRDENKKVSICNTGLLLDISIKWALAFDVSKYM